MKFSTPSTFMSDSPHQMTTSLCFRCTFSGHHPPLPRPRSSRKQGVRRLKRRKIGCTEVLGFWPETRFLPCNLKMGKTAGQRPETSKKIVSIAYKLRRTTRERRETRFTASKPGTRTDSWVGGECRNSHMGDRRKTDAHKQRVRRKRLELIVRSE